MEQNILIFKLFFFIILAPFFVLGEEIFINGKATVIDGDTINIDNNKIRLHGMDAPEINQTCNIKDEEWNCGIESTLALKNFVLDKKVNCEVVDIDRYERYVAICFVGTENINEFMVKNGWAIAYRYYSLDYVKQEEIAKKNNAGIWQGKFLEPYLFRKKQK
tara:strand:- start:299 stop:784 length:486 start_codon:yes stop_codon:yes gene_type:complete